MGELNPKFIFPELFFSKENIYCGNSSNLSVVWNTAVHSEIFTVVKWPSPWFSPIIKAARRSNQSIPKKISPEYSLEVLMLKLKLQYLATWCKELTYLKRPWMGWGGRRERELGWEIHVNPWLIHVNVWQKLLQYCKVINLQPIKKRKNNKDSKFLYMYTYICTYMCVCVCIYIYIYT